VVDALDHAERPVTPTAPALLAAVAVLVLAATRASAIPVRLRRLVQPEPDTLRRRLDPLSLLGRPVRSVGRRPPDPSADRRLGAHLLVGAGLAVVFPPFGVVWAAGAAGASVLRRRRSATRAEVDLREELPEVVDLLSLAVSAGLTVPLAVGVVAERGSGRVATELARARRSSAVGTPLADALDAIPARLGEPVRPITRILAGSIRDGTAIGPALERVAGEVRVERRRGAEERARKVSVRLLFPLVCCVLPAFALLTVVPLLVVSLSGISL
jgi:tight adherence protein C